MNQTNRFLSLCALLSVLSAVPATGQSLTTNIISVAEDAFVSAYELFNENELWMGNRTFGNVPPVIEYRSALSFPLPFGMDSNRIQSARLKLYYHDAWGSFNVRSIEAHRLTAFWNEFSLPFEIPYAPAFTATNVGNIDFGWRTWDVTDMVRYWAAHPAENYGLILVSPAGNTDNALRFHSSESTNPDFHPVLEVVEYPKPPEFVGAIQTQISPPGAAGFAMWRVDGGGWNTAGQIQTNIPAGNHLVEFSPISAWSKPDPITIRVIGNQISSNTVSYTPLNAIEIGEIPTQRVYQGTPAQFQLVATKLGVGATFYFTVDSYPGGSINLEYWTGHFSYTPASSDKQPFNVTFFANLGTNTISQTVGFQPIPSLPAERTVFGLPATHAVPGEESNDYIQVNTIKGAGGEMFNNQYRTNREVTVSGKTIVIQNGHPNGLYVYHENDDLKKFTIHAETLIVRAAFHLPQTEVTIYAREIRFEGANARIDTTPRSWMTRPAQFTNGVDGLTAGNIGLQVEQFVSQPLGITRFLLNGGNGRDGGLGQDGTPSTSLTLPTYNFGGCPWPNNATTMFIYDNAQNFSYTPSSSFWSSSQWRPADGGDAQPGGRPGSAGNAGKLYGSLPLHSLTSMLGGVAGAGSLSLGGDPAGPRPAYRTQRIQGTWSILGTHYSSWGRSAESPPAITADGNPGAVVLQGHSLSWLSPYALRMIIAHAKDAYLYGHSDVADSVFAEYESLLLRYQSMPVWSGLDEKWRFQFSELLLEIQTLRHRIKSHLDYFGNPAGWVPMLSFEANKAAYEVEIERAIRVMYLAYWIGNSASGIQAKLDGLTAAKQNTAADVETFRTRYNEAINQIPVLKTDAAAIAVEEQKRLEDLKWLEQRLLARAQQNVEERNRTPEWVKAVGVLGTICKVIPIYQPALAAIGTGLTEIAKNNTKNPLGTAQGIASIVGTLRDDELLEQSAYNWATNADTFELSVVQDDGLEDFKADMQALFNLAKPVVTEVAKYQDSQQQTEIPKTEVEAELAKLKAESPEFQEITARIQVLLADKEKFATKLNLTLQAVSRLSAEIAHGLLSLDAMHRSLADGNRIIDQETLSYLKEMDRRAKNRLLKYHYWVAKSYEYRLLKPYPNELNLTPFFNKMAVIAATNQQTLTPNDYQALKAIYEESLSSIAFDVLTDYNNNRPEQSVPVDFNLTANQLARLNSGEPVLINLHDMGIFPLNEENHRIVEWRIYNTNIQAHLVGGPVVFAFLDLNLEHSGRSILANAGKVYSFQHYNDSTFNPFTWGVRYSALSGSVAPFEPSVASESLIRSLLGAEGTDPNMELYSRPAAWADIVLTKQVFADTDVDIVIDGLRLQVQYDFIRKRTDQSTLEVKATTGIAPYFTFNLADVNGRKDALGEALRVYNRNVSVSITTPTNFGAWRFVRWTDQFGSSLPGGGTSNTAYTVLLNDNKSLKANYVYSNTNDLDADSIADAWERQYFGSTTNVNLLTDHDGDGVPDAQESWMGSNPLSVDTDGDSMSDLAEFIAGTSSTSAASKFLLGAPALASASGDFIVSWETIPDRIYRVYEKANLQGNWTNVYSVSGIAGTARYTNQVQLPGTKYFRVGVEMPIVP